MELEPATKSCLKEAIEAATREIIGWNLMAVVAVTVLAIAFVKIFN